MHGLVQICFLVTLACVGLSGTANPDVKARFTQNANFVVATLERLATQVKIPDQTRNSGGWTLRFSGLRITDFTIPSSSMKYTKNKLHWSVSGAGIALRGTFQAKSNGWIPFSTTVSFSVSLSGVGFSTTIKVGNANGRPHLTGNGCYSQISGVNLDFHGGFIKTLIYKFLSAIKGVEGVIKNAVKSQLCPLITKAINKDVNRLLANIPKNLVKKSLLEYSRAATFDSKLMETSH